MYIKSPNGTQLWSNNGVVINTAIGPSLTVLPNNDVVIGWLDENTNKRSLMQRLAAANGATLWATAATVLPVTATHKTFPGLIVPLSGNGFIHVFHNLANFRGFQSTLWAQRYDSAGIKQWASPVQVSNMITQWGVTYPSAQMNNDTLYFGYKAGNSSNTRSDCFVQRVNPDGTLPWGINGSDFSTNNANYEVSALINLVPATNSVWACSQFTDPTQGLAGTYVQKFDMQLGTRQFTDTAKMIYPITAAPYMTPLGISAFSDNNPLLFVGKYVDYNNQFLYATKLDNKSANKVWATDTVALGSFGATKARMTMTNVVNDQAVAMWTETKDPLYGDLPFLQPIRTDGRTGLLAPVASFTANNTSVCPNDSVRFTSTSTGYISSYAWSFPGGSPATSTLANPVVAYNSFGVYNVSLTVTNGGGTNTATKTNYITVNGATISLSAIPATVCKSDTPFVLKATPVGGSFAIDGISAPTGIFAPSVLGVGNHTVKYTISVNGCISSSTKTVTVNECSERHLLLDNPTAVIVRNNPTADKFSLFMNTDLYSKISLHTYNSLGQLIYSSDINNLYYGSVIQMDLSSKPAGVYFLFVYSNQDGINAKRTIRIIKY